MEICYGLITSAFEAWIEHVVTGRPIVAENLLCRRWNLLNQVFYLWREVNYILHQRQDAEACAVDSRIARDGWDGCLREREVLSLASSDEDDSWACGARPWAACHGRGLHFFRVVRFTRHCRALEGGCGRSGCTRSKDASKRVSKQSIKQASK